MNIDGVFRNLAALGASWVLWLLVVLSVLALGVILERCAFFCRTGSETAKLRTRLRHGLSRGELGPTRKCLDDSPSMEARIVRAGVISREQIVAVVGEELLREVAADDDASDGASDGTTQDSPDAPGSPDAPSSPAAASDRGATDDGADAAAS